MDTINKKAYKIFKRQDFEVLFSYGSLMSYQVAFTRCQDSLCLGTYHLPDYKLGFATHANVLPKDGSYVPGVLWLVSKSDRQRLDSFEGVGASYYKRVYQKDPYRISFDYCAEDDLGTPLVTKIETSLPFYWYEMTEDAWIQGRWQPTVPYLEGIIWSYRYRDFDPTPLLQALQEVGIDSDLEDLLKSHNLDLANVSK